MYALNKELKRLEPSETKCQFCESADSVDMEDNFFIPLFKENDRTNIVVYRSVKYSKIPVGIPRCKECKAIHDTSSTKSNLIAWFGALGLVILFFFISIGMGFIAIFAGIFIGAFGSRYLYQKFVRDKQIYNEKEGALENPAVQELILNGWSFNQPMA